MKHRLQDSIKIPKYDKVYHDINTNAIRLINPCRRGCVFCFSRQNKHIDPLDKYSQKSMSIDEFKDVLNKRDYNKNVAFVGGDIFDYPLIYDFIKIVTDKLEINKKLNLDINSTFGDFDPSKLHIFKERTNIRLSLSLMTFDTGFKDSIMRGGWTENQTEMVKEVISSGVLSSCVIWNFGDLDRLKKDLEIFKRLYNKGRDDFSLMLSYPAATRYSNKIAKMLSKQALNSWQDSINIFLEFIKKNNINGQLYSYNDLSKDYSACMPRQKDLMDNFKSRIRKALLYIIKESQFNIKDVAFITSKSCYRFGRYIFPELNWIKAENNHYGEDISCCSLLVPEDIYKAIRQNREYKAYILNKDMIKKDDSFKSRDQLEKTIGCSLLFF